MLRSISLCLCGLVFSALSACDPGSNLSDPQKKSGPVAQFANCTSNEIRVDSACVALPDVKLNTVGYLIGRAKRATVPDVPGVDAFSVVSADTGEVVFAGTLAAATTNADTRDTTRIADFTALDVEGTYALKVDGLAPSPPFRIGVDVLNAPLRVTMLGLYGQRCGVAVRFTHLGDTFQHPACHQQDALQNDLVVDGTGGWHDAGDYGKYTVNAAFALAFLLKAWEDFGTGLLRFSHIPTYSGELPAWLAESKFQLDQILKMQLPDGSAVHLLGPYQRPPATGRASFPGMVSPEGDGTVRAFSGPSTTATADLAAVAAMAARVFRPFDPAYADKCLIAAQAAVAYLDQNPDTAWPDLARFTHDAYRTGSGDSDDRFWAEVELWRTTGDPGLLAKVESSLRSTVQINFDWGNVDNLGMFSYVQAKSDARDPSKLSAAQQAIVASADSLVSGAARHAYGRGIEQMYYWGVNGVLARSVTNLLVANSIAANPKYLDAAVQQIDHLLGRNALGRSYVTGLGYLPARNPHHRPSQSDSATAPWPGLLVGGPNPGKDDDPVKASKGADRAPGMMWFDDAGSYGTNEVAINWNTPLAYALAAFYQATDPT